MILYTAMILYSFTIALLIKRNQRLNDEINRLRRIEKYNYLKERVDTYKSNVNDAIREADENETWG